MHALRWILVWGLILLGSAALGARAGTQAALPMDASRERKARELEQHMIAPCCWRETLDVHTSPVTTELRAEIRRRIAQGESPDDIESDLVSRYGPRIRTELPKSLGIWLLLILGIGGGFLLYLVASAPKKAPTVRAEDTPLTTRDRQLDKEYEWQLDQDLLDD